MTVVDAHVHCPSSRGLWGLSHYSADEYLATMDSAQVDQAWVLPLDGLVHEPGPTNDELAAWCSAAPHRLIPFATSDARREGALEEMTRCVETLGVRGFKFHPWAQGFHVLDLQWRPLFTRARDLGVPVILHDGTPPDSSPLQVAQLAVEVPGLVVVLGHGGLHDLWQEAAASVRLADTIYIAMTSLSPGVMARLMDRVPLDRLMFGSDGGVASHADQQYVRARWAGVRGVGLSPSELEVVTGVTPRLVLDRASR